MRPSSGKQCWPRLKGFTLIELLIVSGVILVLIAIALPYFLNALLRAKITQAKNDLKTIAVALESYELEYMRYPPNVFYEPHPRFYPASARASILFLTSPIPYLEEVPLDIFAPQDTGPPSKHPELLPFGAEDQKHGYSYYFFSRHSCDLNDSCKPIARGYEQNGLEYTIRSAGPDGDLDPNPNPQNKDFRNRVGPMFYDPRNGPDSDGDIIFWRTWY